MKTYYQKSQKIYDMVKLDEKRSATSIYKETKGTSYGMRKQDLLSSVKEFKTMLKITKSDAAFREGYRYASERRDFIKEMSPLRKIKDKDRRQRNLKILKDPSDAQTARLHAIYDEDRDMICYESY